MTLKDLLPPIIHGLTAPLQQASRGNFHLDPAASYHCIEGDPPHYNMFSFSSHDQDPDSQDSEDEEAEDEESDRASRVGLWTVDLDELDDDYTRCFNFDAVDPISRSPHLQQAITSILLELCTSTKVEKRSAIQG